MSLQKVFLKGLFSTLEFVGVVLVFSEESCWVESRALQKPISAPSFRLRSAYLSVWRSMMVQWVDWALGGHSSLSCDSSLGGGGSRRTRFGVVSSVAEPNKSLQ